MNYGWKRITKHVWRLDDRWQAVEETPNQWRAYRGSQALLADFPTVEGAFAEAERLKAADRLYAV